MNDFCLPTAIGARLGEVKRASGTDAEGRSCMLRMRLTGGYSRSCDGIVRENHQYRASIQRSRTFHKNVDPLACALPDDVKFPRKYSLLLTSPPTSERWEREERKSFTASCLLKAASTSGKAGRIPC